MRVVGLNAKPELNGKRGRVVGHQGARLQVELGDGTQLALKPANLQPEIAPPERAPAPDLGGSAGQVASSSRDSSTHGDASSAPTDRQGDTAPSQKPAATRGTRLRPLIRWPPKLVAVALPLAVVCVALAIDRLSGQIW